MKVTVVPAQVTTVEDRIIGSLGFSQLLLLVVPIFFSAATFAMLPPLMGYATYKVILMGLAALVCCTLAIRIKGKILAFWLVAILRYNLRAKYYVFNKNSIAHRERYDTKNLESDEATEKTQEKRSITVPRLEFHEAAKVLATIDNPATNLRFETSKKGALYVRLTEVEE
jgi:hypothetical protein